MESVDTPAGGIIPAFEVRPHIWPTVTPGGAVSFKQPACLMAIVPGLGGDRRTIQRPRLCLVLGDGGAALRIISPDNQAALEQRILMPRDFIWFVVRDRSTGAAVTDGYWSDIGDFSAAVIDPDTGLPVTGIWHGAGSLISVSDIPLVSNITVQNITVTLSQVADRVNALVRQYDCKQGRVEIYRGLFDPTNRLMVAPAEPRFVGTINEAPIHTPAAGGAGDVQLDCTSNTAELTRSSTDVRSDASQRLRNSADAFFADTAVVGTWQLFWGSERVSSIRRRKAFASSSTRVSGYDPAGSRRRHAARGAVA